MNIQLADYLVHFSNILLLVAYSVRDILWLREVIELLFVLGEDDRGVARDRCARSDTD